MLEVTETIECCGHVNVRATHKTTFEVTKEDHLSERGTCIIGTCASKGAADLSDSFKEVLNTPGSTLVTTLSCKGINVIIHSRGGPGLSLCHHTDLVWRKSNFTCERTIGIMSTLSANDIPRNFIELLKSAAKLTVVLMVREWSEFEVVLPVKMMDFPE